MQTGEIEYNQVPTLTYKHPPVQNNRPQSIERGTIQNTNYEYSGEGVLESPWSK